eukprot:gnl/Dysnectes_brevis/560_a618_4027.p2 GENE.gnl/Dysnectes_brevis/560_a618_4027~~gnl/Dysnectes_brevis/560_a618_4027.p2  ORF type:complete len:198 (+),score=78.93 gnl/Dysnectes_brevis/560_a618_4027:1241-1834(+)
MNILVGQQAPDFDVTVMTPMMMTFERRKLSDYAGKYLLILFYPADFTFACPTEIIAFSEAAEEFRKIGCEVLIGSTDSEYTHFAWVSTPRAEGGLGPMKTDLFADRSQKMSRDYGVLLPGGAALRGMFIISDKGILRQATVNDLSVGRNVAEAKRLVQAFMYADKTGQAVPCDWEPGMDTITQDPLKSKEFFRKTYE